MSPSEEMHRLRATGIPTFESRVAEEGVSVLQVETVDILQVNLGKLCNQVCTHCHVDAGPDRTENMTAETTGQVLELLKKHPIPTLDLTGGAPELNPNFRMLVREARALGRNVLDRCNLTVLTLKSQPGLIDFLAEHQVEVVASLPSFRQAGTDAQRGDGIFVKSILALKRLNEAGYGRGNGLKLNLVYNPVGAFLPASQTSLERDYKRELAERFDVVFDNLFTITNMPIRRYLEYLERSGNLQSYMELLAGAFNPAAAEAVMCRNYLSVGWDGQLYDCDFNQMLEMPVNSGAADTLSALLVSGELRRRVRTGTHCFGCTAGSGSSCAGSVAE
jgi:radical SAM/Cys-rich protein